MNIYDKAISLYSRITKKTILLVNKKYSTYYTPNGSVVKSPRVKEGDVVRGNRAKCIHFYDDFYSKEDIDEIIGDAIKPFTIEKEEEKINEL